MYANTHTYVYFKFPLVTHFALAICLFLDSELHGVQIYSSEHLSFKAGTMLNMQLSLTYKSNKQMQISGREVLGG